MGAQNYNYAPKFPQNGGFPAPNLFLEENFRTGYNLWGQPGHHSL